MTTYRTQFRVNDDRNLSSIEEKTFKIFDYLMAELPEAEDVKVEAIGDDDEVLVTAEEGRTF